MEIIPTHNWLYTSKEEPRGYIQPHSLKELWFHTGTACNLACPFCLEGSKPGDNRLNRINLEDVEPYIQEALTLGVEQFSFTGGEPFIVKDFVHILSYAASHRPCLVLTNGTEPVLRRAEAIKGLIGSAHPIAFRVSIDYLDAKRHDAGRGEGSFLNAIEGVLLLHSFGFKVSIARQMEKGENTELADQAYQNLLAEHGIEGDINIVAFPDFLTPKAQAEVPEITETCMTQYQNEANRLNYMCAYSKMIVKEDGKMKIFSCTLVDDDPRYAFEGTLRDSLTEKVILAHHRCYSCFAFGASCSEK